MPCPACGIHRSGKCHYPAGVCAARADGHSFCSRSTCACPLFAVRQDACRAPAPFPEAGAAPARRPSAGQPLPAWRSIGALGSSPLRPCRLHHRSWLSDFARQAIQPPFRTNARSAQRLYERLIREPDKSAGSDFSAGAGTLSLSRLATPLPARRTAPGIRTARCTPGSA